MDKLWPAWQVSLKKCMSVSVYRCYTCMPVVRTVIVWSNPPFQFTSPPPILTSSLIPPTSSTTSCSLPHYPHLLIQHRPPRVIGITSTLCLSLSASFSFFLFSSVYISLHAHSSSHRAGSIKSSRRSSYLLAITTERSKSCDEGLNTFREEGRVFSWVPSNWDSWQLVALKRRLFSDVCSTCFDGCVVVLCRRLPKRVKSFFTDGVSPLFSSSKPYCF